MPNTYFGLRQIVFRPVICSGQPQSEPRNGLGHAKRNDDLLASGGVEHPSRGDPTNSAWSSEGFAHTAERDGIRPRPARRLPRAASRQSGSNWRCSGPPILSWSTPVTWGRVYSEHIGNTFGPNGFSMGSTRMVSSSRDRENTRRLRTLYALNAENHRKRLDFRPRLGREIGSVRSGLLNGTATVSGRQQTPTARSGREACSRSPCVM